MLSNLNHLGSGHMGLGLQIQRVQYVLTDTLQRISHASENTENSDV